VLIMKKTLWKNNQNFAKDVPVIYVNFSINVLTFSETKIGDITFVPPIVNDGLACCSVHSDGVL
jgi:hypothetical protein